MQLNSPTDIPGHYHACDAGPQDNMFDLSAEVARQRPIVTLSTLNGTGQPRMACRLQSADYFCVRDRWGQPGVVRLCPSRRLCLIDLHAHDELM